MKVEDLIRDAESVAFGKGTTALLVFMDVLAGKISSSEHSPDWHTKLADEFPNLHSFVEARKVTKKEAKKEWIRSLDFFKKTGESFQESKLKDLRATQCGAVVLAREFCTRWEVYLTGKTEIREDCTTYQIMSDLVGGENLK